MQTTQGEIRYGFLINCAGAYADTVAKAYGLANEYALVPFKGIYWKLSKSANSKVRANIYPVPDVSMPFLGVHLTRVINGDVYIGPTAIPAFGRENYGIVQGLSLTESVAIGYQLAGMYLRNENNFRKLAHHEMGKYSKQNFLGAAKKLMPSLNEDDMVPTPKAGIRPQLVNTKTRKLEMDYILANTDDSLHVLNAISPAFTGSWAFAELIADRIGA
jgi:L-2-hydroxyglutarate oxidase LhgO